MGLINRQKFKLPNEKVKMVWSSGKSPLIFCVCQIAVALGVRHTHTHGRPIWPASGRFSFSINGRAAQMCTLSFHLWSKRLHTSHDDQKPTADRMILARPPITPCLLSGGSRASWNDINTTRNDQQLLTIELQFSREMSRANTTNMSGIFLPIWLKYKPFDSSLKVLQLCFWA